MREEDLIRDYLASNLSLIENGLRLVDTEYQLENKLGARGRVDILARDQFGLLVIIEIKRSDDSSRQALHEFHKYVALFRMNYGLGSQQFRCIVVSTQWHELLVPFSSYARTVDYHVDGYKLELDSEGRPCKAIPVSLAPEGELRHLCPCRVIYFYIYNENRTRNMTILENVLKEMNISDYCLIELDHKIGNIPYPFSIYFVIDTFDHVSRQALEQLLNLDQDDIELGSEVNEWYFEECILADINRQSIGKYDSIEIGYPEKFVNALEKWDVRKINRHGRLASLEILPDDALIREIMGIGGDHSAIYYTVVTPKYGDLWQVSLTKAQFILEGNKRWSSGLKWFLEEVAQNAPTSTVAIMIFNPANIMGSLYMLYTKGTHSYLPSLEIVVDDPEKERLLILSGGLEWDGKTCPSDPALIVRDLFQDEWTFFSHG